MIIRKATVRPAWEQASCLGDQQLKHAPSFLSNYSQVLGTKVRAPFPTLPACPVAKRDSSKRVKNKCILSHLAKRETQKTGPVLLEVHIFSDLFVWKRKSPSCPSAMDAINRAAAHSQQLLTHSRRVELQSPERDVLGLSTISLARFLSNSGWREKASSSPGPEGRWPRHCN